MTPPRGAALALAWAWFLFSLYRLTALSDFWRISGPTGIGLPASPTWCSYRHWSPLWHVPLKKGMPLLFFSGLGSDFPRLPLPPPLPPFLASGGLPSTLARLVWEAPRAWPFAFGRGVVGVVALICVALIYVSSLLSSSGSLQPCWLLGFGRDWWSRDSREMSRNCGILYQRDFHKREELNDSVGLGFIIGMVLDFCWNTKFTFLFAAKCLVRILMKDWCSCVAVGNLPPISTKLLPAHFQFCKPIVTWTTEGPASGGACR